MSKTTEIDALIAAYAERLEGIYEQRTAGDYTFTGVLAMFSIELSQLVAEQARAESESDAEARTKVQVITWQAPSDRNPGESYRVTMITPPGGEHAFSCTCPHYRYRLTNCKHMERAQRGGYGAESIKYVDA